MSHATERRILRAIHILFTIPILGYVYSPFEQLPGYAGRVRFFFVPVLVLSGLWMWKGHVLRRWFTPGSASVRPASAPQSPDIPRLGS